ncbi:MAG TPA: WXG100 family type VII secretion target [Ilumatobacter sp.]|nr:WXG100 family type VII secretion target [Ilumatobacter sp.]
MSGQVGAELGQMQHLKKTFDANAQRGAELLTAVRSSLDSTWWKGPAADRFRQAWASEFEPALKKLEAALAEAGTEVQRRHDALQAAGG